MWTGVQILRAHAHCLSYRVYSDAAYNFCLEVRVHRLPRRYGEAPAAPIVRVVCAGGGLGIVVVGVKIYIF